MDVGFWLQELFTKSCTPHVKYNLFVCCLLTIAVQQPTPDYRPAHYYSLSVVYYGWLKFSRKVVRLGKNYLLTKVFPQVIVINIETIFGPDILHYFKI